MFFFFLSKTGSDVIIRDAVIISLMDSFTSFLAGITIFSILGNLAHESGQNITDVVSAGTGLAFVSYPDAISKFEYLPQVRFPYYYLKAKTKMNFFFCYSCLPFCSF